MTLDAETLLKSAATSGKRRSLTELVIQALNELRQKDPLALRRTLLGAEGSFVAPLLRTTCYNEGMQTPVVPA